PAQSSSNGFKLLQSGLNCFNLVQIGFIHLERKIVFIGLLGFLWGSSSADSNINVSNDNDTDDGGQRVSINNQHNVANIDNDNGWNSWNSIWDYNTGFAATRIFAKKTCIVHRLNRKVVPALQDLEKMSKERKANVHTGLSPQSLHYKIEPEETKDLTQFGSPIENMCKGLRTYQAQEVQGQSFYFHSGSCFRINVLWLMGISLCGDVTAS
uniref:Gastrokine-1 n=1 Tax=Sarcophilus harrisii TaxID=9305 RepID=G3W5E0_SARHA